MERDVGMELSRTNRVSEKVDALLALKACVQSLTAADWKTQRTPLVTFFESKMETDDYPFLQSLGEMREAQSEIPAPLLSRAEELFGRLRHTSGEIPDVPQMETEEEILEVVFPVRNLQGGQSSFGREIPPDLAAPFAKFIGWWNLGSKKQVFWDESDEQSIALLESTDVEQVSTLYCEVGALVVYAVLPGYLPPTFSEVSYPMGWCVSKSRWPAEIWVDEVFVLGEYQSGLLAAGRGSCTSCRGRWGLAPDEDCQDCSGYGTRLYEFYEHVDMTSQDQ